MYLYWRAQVANEDYVSAFKVLKTGTNNWVILFATQASKKPHGIARVFYKKFWNESELYISASPDADSKVNVVLHWRYFTT